MSKVIIYKKTSQISDCSDILADPNMKKPKAPVMFLKPSSSYIVEGQDIVVRLVYF